MKKLLLLLLLANMPSVALRAMAGRPILVMQSDSDSESTEDGNPELVSAVQQDNLVRVQQLLANGVDIDEQGALGCTALHVAAVAGNSALVTYLIESGAQIEVRNYWGQTPLLGACNKRQIDMVKLLHQHGARIDGSDDSGNTCLISAAWEHNYDLVQWLLEQGVSVNERNTAGSTALSCAVRSVKDLDPVAVVALLLHHGADFGTRDNNGCTIVHMAASRKEANLLLFLIKHNPFDDIDVKDNKGDTPLHVAVRQGRNHAASMLLRCKADPHAENNNGETPLGIIDQKVEAESAKRARRARNDGR